jgi:hypothetical protein
MFVTYSNKTKNVGDECCEATDVFDDFKNKVPIMK